MSVFGEKIKIEGFSVEGIDLSEIEELVNWMPTNNVMDLNLAELGLVKTLHGQNACQEKILLLDRWISIKENEKNKAYAEAALTKAAAAGHKTAKDREWFAQADDAYIEKCNELAIAKAAKKWFENKADYFSGWHYSFKTFLKRDYSLEKLGNYQVSSHVENDEPVRVGNDFGGEEIPWRD